VHWGSDGHWGVQRGSVVSSDRGSDLSSDHWGGQVGGNDGCGLVDEDGSWVLGLNAWLIGLDVSSETSGISHVVDNSASAVNISETIRSNHHTRASLLSSEGTTGRVVFVVAESIVANVVLASELG
jgi:hypothetical protein